MYSYVTRMLLVCIRMYPYVTRMYRVRIVCYSYHVLLVVLVWSISQDQQGLGSSADKPLAELDWRFVP